MTKKKKALRNRNGEGSVKLRKDGRYEYKYTLYDVVTGKTVRKSIYDKDEGELYKKIHELQYKINTGKVVDPSKLTLWEWIHEWLHVYKKSCLRDTTFDSYEITAQKHIMNEPIGDMLLSKLTTEDLQRFYDSKIKGSDKVCVKCDTCKFELTDKNEISNLERKSRYHRVCPKCGGQVKTIRKGISIRTIHYLRTQIIGAALKKAKQTKKINDNPNEGTEIPALKYQKTAPFTREQMLKFKSVCEKDPLYPAIYLDMTTGLRIGELLALKWDDIDLDSNIINIKRTVARVRTPNGATKTALKDGDPKTKKSKGSIYISNKTVAVLKKHKLVQKIQEIAMGEKYHKLNFVFCYDDGRRFDPKNFRDRYKTLLKKAGLPDNKFHALRHTFGALLLEEGEELKVIQELLRHENLQTTADIYVDVTDKLKKKAVSKMDAIL